MTITDRNDLQVALKEVVEQADRLQAQHGGPKLPNMVPPVRIHATRAKSEVSPKRVIISLPEPASHESSCRDPEFVYTSVLHAFCPATGLTWHLQGQIGAYKAKLCMAAASSCITMAPSCCVCHTELAEVDMLSI